MSHVSDTRRQGNAFYGAAGQSDGGELGVALPVLVTKEFGAVTTLAPTGVCVNATGVAGGGALSATGALVSSGTATFDIARNVTLTSTSNNSTLSFTVTGTDQYGKAQTETITGPNNTTVGGVKAFKTVTSIVSSTTIVGLMSAGTGDVYGLPWHLADKGKILAYTVDGVPSPNPTVVAGFSTTGTSTATTADVRGTITATTASNSSIRFSVMMVVNPASKESLYGAAPA